MTEQLKVLVAEDDHTISATLSDWLRNSGFAVESVYSGLDADASVARETFDVVVLDLGLPGMDGMEVLTRLRGNNPQTSVIITTARDSLSHKLHGLNLGADDYLTKPFELAELEARIRSILRRKTVRAATRISIGDLSIDKDLHDGLIGEQRLNLTRTEFDLLAILIESGKTVAPREVICEKLGSENAPMADNTLEVNVSRLRKKIAASNVTLKSFRGIGYSLTERT